MTSGGRRTEDGATVHLRAGGIPGRFTTAWHLPGFDMPENHLRIDTDRGYVLCTTSCAAFVGDGEVQIVHQVDADTGFDLAPMDAGGAFWAEQDLLASRHAGRELARGREPGRGPDHRTCTAPRRASTAPRRARPARRSPPDPVERGSAGVTMPDLRGAPDGVAERGRRRSSARSIRTREAAAIVALPDAPGHFRTLTNNGAVALGAPAAACTNLGRAAFGVSPRGALSAGGRTWEALLVLMRAELGASRAPTPARSWSTPTSSTSRPRPATSP